MLDVEIKKAVKEAIAGFHSRGLPKAFERDVEVPEFKEVNKVFVILVPRRAGKSYMLYQIMQELLKKGLDLVDFLYLNFEDERISEMKASQLGLALEAYGELYPDKRPLLFFDEIQNVAAWEKFVRRVNDEAYRVYVTGSNSRLLSKEIATAVRGRDYPIQVMPLSFKEFLGIRGIRPGRNWEFNGTKAAVKKAFDEFMHLSGFPEIVLEKKLEFIDQYFKTTLFQDIVERFKVENIELMRLLMKNLTRQYASEYSMNKFNNFAKSSGYKSSTSVIQKYSKCLEDAYFCFFVNAKQKSFKKESAYLKKAYVCDHGFINYYNTEKDPGRILENIVFTELFRRGNTEINYYKNGFECDFLTKDACIQVCHTLTEENKKRETRGLEEAIQRFGGRKGIIITYDQETRIGKTRVTPAWKWLLER